MSGVGSLGVGFVVVSVGSDGGVFGVFGVDGIVGFGSVSVPVPVPLPGFGFVGAGAGTGAGTGFVVGLLCAAAAISPILREFPVRGATVCSHKKSGRS